MFFAKPGNEDFDHGTQRVSSLSIRNRYLALLHIHIDDGPVRISVGDFIAGINLIIDSVKSFSETCGTKADHQELGGQLTSLKSALDGIQALPLDASNAAQISAVNPAADGCRLCVEGFVQRNSKFESLHARPAKQWSLAALRNRGLGIQWAILKKAEVVKFRAEVQQHSDNIHMLLATLQIKQIDDESKLRVIADQRNIEQQDLTEDIHAKFINSGADQQHIETALSDQHDIIATIKHTTQDISGQQASLAQSMKVQHGDIQTQIQMIGEIHNDVLTAQNKTTVQLNANVQDLNNQIEALKALELSLVEIVSFRSVDVRI